MRRHNLSARTLWRTHWALLLFALATTLTIAGQTWWAIVQDKQQTLASETNNGLVAVRLMEEHANQTLQDAVHTLDRVARAVLASDHHESPAVIRGIVASHDIGHSRHLKALQYVSPQGSSWISSPDYPTHQTEASQHSHIQYLLKNPADDEPVVGHPYASPYDSQWVIPVARTLYDQRGLPAGVVSVDIRLSYFGTLYSRVAKENKACVTLLSNQGFILARSPFEARYVGRDVTDSPWLDTLRAGAVEGSFDDDTFLDDDEGSKLYSYRRLAGFPVTMVYARDYANVLASWENRTSERLLLAVFSIALVAALTYTLRVYIQRLQRAKLSLHDSEAKFFGLFRQSPVPHTLVRIQSGQFVEVNDAWLTQYGYQLQEVIGRTAHELGLWVNLEQRKQLVAALARASELIRSFKRVAVDQSSDQRRVFDLQTTLREVCLTLEPMYKNTPFDLTLALPDKVEMDSFPGALGQLVTNFVSNALQHGFEGRERGQMHVGAQASGVDHVTLLFSDDGLGMTEETRNRVFDPFFTTKLGQGGSGLGMNIVYNIVHDVLGGSIQIASSPDAGTLITVTIPVRAPLSATGESHLRQPVA